MEKLYGELIMCIIKLFWILFILSDLTIWEVFLKMAQSVQDFQFYGVWLNQQKLADQNLVV